MLSLYVRFKNFMNREEGQGMVEYGLVVGLVALVVIGAVFLLGGRLESLFTGILESLNDPNNGVPAASGN